MAELALLSEIQSPDLINFNTSDIIDEIIDRIQRHPEWNQLWNGELKQDALYVIINIFAYLFSKNAEVANRLIKENFILLAKDPNNIINIMSNYGLRIRSNTHSVANIMIRKTDGGVLTSDILLPSNPGSPFGILASSAGQNVNFEIYEKDENGKINYFSPIILRKGLVNNLVAYSGSTAFETVEIDSQEKKEKFVYFLKNSPVIEDSIRVYYLYNEQRIELVETESFTVKAIGDTDRFPGGQPYYKISYNDVGQATIIFGTQFFGGSFPKNEMGQLEVYYRYGGGSASNVKSGIINYTTTVSDIELTFTNNGDSGGGVNVEDFNLAKFYAPMRVGRGKQIVDEKDALLALAGMTVKHAVISPKYSILPNKDSVPILHYYNYIVPQRNFTEFILPTPTIDDSVTTYEYKMRSALNDFLNLSKIHDGMVSGETIVESYTENNIQYPLKYKPILSGTLTVSAYDHYNMEIDRLIYSSSYFGETNLNDVNTSTAKLKSYTELTETVFNLNDRNIFDFEMDGYFLQIIIPNQLNGVSIQYGTPLALAEKINELIIQKIKDSWATPSPLMLIPTGQNYINLNYNYFYFENNRFYLNSPTIGANSSLKIFVDESETNRKKFLSLIKFIGGNFDFRFTYAVPESRKIFLDNSNFNYQNNTLDIKLNLDDISRTITLNDMIEWPDRNSNVGPFLSYELRDENLKNIYLQKFSDLVLEIYDQYDILKDRIIYESVSYGQLTPGFRTNVDKDGNEIQGQQEIFKDPDSDINGIYSLTYFDYANSKIYFALADADDEQTSTPYSFPREPFVNSLLDNSISDVWVQYDDGIEASLPVDGFGKKFNFISNNFILFPSPDPLTLNDNIPTGWQYYYDTFEQTETVLVEQEDPDPANWYYDTISYEQKTLVPRVDENGDPVLDNNGFQIIDEVWLPYSTTIYLKSLYDVIILDIANYRNIIVGTLIKPLIQVPVETTINLPSPTIVDGEGNSSSVTNKLKLIKSNYNQNNKYLLEKKAENSLGCGVSYNFEIDDQNTNSQLVFKFTYSFYSNEEDEYENEFVNGDIITYIIAENEEKTVIFEDVAITINNNSFQTVLNSINVKNYKLAFHVVNEKLNKYKIFLDQIEIYQEPIDTVYYLELLADSAESITLYKPATSSSQQTIRGQGVAYDFTLLNNAECKLTLDYEIDDGTYKDILGVSIIGMRLIDNVYTYTLIDLNDQFDNSLTTTSKMNNIIFDNNNNNKISVAFNTSNYSRFRMVIHARTNQNESFQMTISNIQVGVKPGDIYNQDFYFKTYFIREKFNTIKCTYEPHPYFQEDESAGYLDILRNQNKRVIGVEPILKKINFNPLGMSLFLTFTSTAKVEEVLNGIEELIISNFSYNNTNENIKIGQIFSLDLIGQKLIEKFISYGLVGAKVTDVNSLISEDPTSGDYYFVSPPILHENLLALENEYPNIQGIAEKYDLKVTYLKI